MSQVKEGKSRGCCPWKDNMSILVANNSAGDPCMSHCLRLAGFGFLMLMMSSPRAGGQEVGTELKGAAERFLKAEREVRAAAKEDYWLAREKMSVQALGIAESD